MKAIATLLQDDPYLKLTPKQRCDERRERREKFFGQTIARVHEVVELPPDKTERIELPIIPEPEPEAAPDPIPDWVERQRRIYKTPWFSIVDEIETPVKKKISVSEIQRACAKHYGVTVSDIISARRTADVVRPRQVAGYLAKKLTLCSLPELGRRFGNRDHTSQLHSVNRIIHLMKTEVGMRETVEMLAREVGGELE